MHRGDAARRRAAQRVDDDQQLHQVVVGRIGRRLEDEHVGAADVLLDLDEDLHVGEAPHHRLGQRGGEIGGDRLGERGIGVAGDELDRSVLRRHGCLLRIRTPDTRRRGDTKAPRAPGNKPVLLSRGFFRRMRRWPRGRAAMCSAASGASPRARRERQGKPGPDRRWRQPPERGLAQERRERAPCCCGRSGGRPASSAAAQASRWRPAAAGSSPRSAARAACRRRRRPRPRRYVVLAAVDMRGHIAAHAVGRRCRVARNHGHAARGRLIVEGRDHAAGTPPAAGRRSIQRRRWLRTGRCVAGRCVRRCRCRRRSPIPLTASAAATPRTRHDRRRRGAPPARRTPRQSIRRPLRPLSEPSRRLNW